MSKNPFLTWPGADARRRIHIWPGDRPAYSFGPASAKFHTEAGTVGAAVEEALAQIGYEPAVIIYEGNR